MQSDAQLLWLCNFVPCLCRVCEAQHPYGTTALAVLQDAVLAANEESLCGSHGGRVVHRCTNNGSLGFATDLECLRGHVEVQAAGALQMAAADRPGSVQCF